jgi:putative FmdB family regulatory protein
MPTYVYECNKCGDEFELYQSFSDEPLKKHPECGGKVTKVFQPVGIVLKGSGFYKNDSRSGSKRANGSTAKSESSDSGSKDGAKDGSKDGSKSESSSSDSSSTKTDTKKSDSSSSGTTKKKSDSSTSTAKSS